MIRILWIDDRPNSLVSFAEKLEQVLDAQLTYASTFTTAYRKLQADNFDILILDLFVEPGGIHPTLKFLEELPGYSSDEVKSRDLAKGIPPVIICSNNPEDDTIRRADWYAYYFPINFFAKFRRPEELVDLIKSILS